MRIIRTLENLTGALRNPVMTIGNFDGVHLGHRELFRRVVTRAAEYDGDAVVLTFDPHPLKIIAPQRAPRLINTRDEKERLIAASQVDVLLDLPFNAALSALTAEEFISRVLVEQVGVRHIIVGFDYAFGAGRRGDIELLSRLGEQCRFGVEVVKPVGTDDEVYSSTRIRRMVGAGQVAEVVAYLGRHYSLKGTVVAGVGRGKQLGFPTANLATEKELIPADGVYAVKVCLDGVIHDGVVNIGRTPTFAAGRYTIEAHLFGLDADLYGKSLRVYFIERLRDEKRFADPLALTQAIATDVERAKELLQGARIIEYHEYLGFGR
ncbi:MAG: bifunctional riboflavin kinase/FAD synthetase [Desulfuromonadales bacterium]|nr:bifunctional riboflavin kinase/FAD synthetase [Desulfuromonadales bacterium]